MKIKGPPLPTLPKVSVEVTKTPSAPGPIPVPYPNVSGGSSFTPGSGVERRYSVRFMQGIENRLKLAGVSPEAAKELTQRLGSLGRSGIDREGPVLDTVLAGAHPKEGVELYGALASLGSIVTPGGFRVEANDEGSWTVHPPGADAFVLADVAGSAHALADGTKLLVEKGGSLVAQLADGASNALKSGESRRLAQLSLQFVLTANAIALSAVPGGGGQAGVESAKLFAMLPSLAEVAGAAGAAAAPVADAAREAASAAGARAGEAAHVARDVAQQAAPVAVAVGVAVATSVVTGVTFGAGAGAGPLLKAGVDAMLRGSEQAFSLLQGALSSAGRAAAPSRTCDPDAERALVLVAAGKNAARLDEAAGAIASLAKQVRGAPRATVMAALQALGH